MVDHNAGTQRHFKSHKDYNCHKCKSWVDWVQEQYIGNLNVYISNPTIYGETEKWIEVRKYVKGIGTFK